MVCGSEGGDLVPVRLKEMTMRTLIRTFLIIASLFPCLLPAQGPGLPASIGLAPVNCEASFTYIQDTNDILIINFYDGSTGTISEYSWDFGDGSAGSGQVVSHSFPGIGTYKVCLTISNSDTANYCSDSICKIIDLTPPQPGYLLGGLLYAGNFPINNPFNTNDFGYAYLYRLQAGTILPVDTVLFDTLGYFYFFDVPEGDYLVKAGLRPNSHHFNSYMPGYYAGSQVWNEADTLHVTTDFFLAHVHMAPLQPLIAGPNSIVGYVTQDEQLIAGSRIAGCEVILSDSAENPLRVGYTDANGSFSFVQLPLGNYTLAAEQAGFFSDVARLTIDELHPVSDSVEIKLHASPQGTLSGQGTLPFDVTLYPNPATDQITLDFRSSRDLAIRYELINSMGNPVLQNNMDLMRGNNHRIIDLTTCPSGLYIMLIRESGSTGRFAAKVIIH